MTLEELAPAWGQDHIAGTLAGDPEAASSLFTAMSNDQRGEAAIVLWEMGIPVSAYQAFLKAAWQHDHLHVMAAAGPTLPDLFKHAAFDAGDLPERVTVWRGTAGLTLKDAAEGPSWTTSRATACWFAMRHADRYGQPLVLRLEVDRGDVLLHTDDRGESEVVIAPEVLAGHYPDPDIDGTPDEWRELFREVEAVATA